MLTNSVWGLGEIKEARKILRIFRASNSKGQSCNSLTEESLDMGTARGAQAARPPRRGSRSRQASKEARPGPVDTQVRRAGQKHGLHWPLCSHLSSVSASGLHTHVRDAGNSGDNLCVAETSTALLGPVLGQWLGGHDRGCPWHVTALEPRKRPCP